MSILPYFYDYNLPQWPRRFMDQYFGLALTPESLFSGETNPMVSRPQLWWPKDTFSSIKMEKDKWQINVDVLHFAPDELTVKFIDGYVVVEGKHEEKRDEHGFISRQFTRRFKLSEDWDLDAVESRLSSDGVLTVFAPKKVNALKGEKNVQISPTGPVRKSLRDELVIMEDKEDK